MGAPLCHAVLLCALAPAALSCASTGARPAEPARFKPAEFNSVLGAKALTRSLARESLPKSIPAPGEARRGGTFGVKRLRYGDHLRLEWGFDGRLQRVIIGSSEGARALARVTGEDDGKGRLVGLHVADVIASLGAPASVDAGRYEWRFDGDGYKGLVSFICPEPNGDICDTLSVRWQPLKARVAPDASPKSSKPVGRAWSFTQPAPTPKAARKGQVSPVDFLTFMGISFGDAEPRFEQFQTSHSQLGDNKGSRRLRSVDYPGHLALSYVSRDFDRRINVIRLRSRQGVEHLASLTGVRDPKADLLGKHVDEVVAVLGTPSKVSSGNYRWDYRSGNKRGMVALLCYEFWNSECREMYVQWFL